MSTKPKLTKREHIAIEAMKAIIAKHPASVMYEDTDNVDVEYSVAVGAVHYADQLIKRLKETK